MSLDDNERDEAHTGSITHIDQPVIITDSPLSKKKHKKMMEADNHVPTPVDHEAIQFIDQEIATILPPPEQMNVCGCSPSRFKIIAGVIIVILIAVSWTGATQFGKNTYSPTFHAPYFVTWYNTCFMIVIYPIFMIPLICKKTPWRMRTFLRQTATIFGPRGFCLKSLMEYLLKCIIPFCVIWLVTNYLYMRSLRKLLPGTVTAVFSSSSCFVYILSLVFLKDKLYLLRVLSVALSIIGIVLMGYSEGFGSSNASGIIYVVLSAFGSALYQVMFKRLMGNASGAQVALFLTLLGLTNVIIFWPILFLMDYFKWEALQLNDVPWVDVNVQGLLGVVFNYLVNFGISVTFPLFISIGTLLGVPLNAVIDSLFRGKGFGMYKIISLFLILGGFLLMLIPDGKLKQYEKRLRCSSNEVSSSEDKKVKDREPNN